MKISDEFFTYYTPSGGMRSGKGAPEIVRLRERETELTGRLNELNGQADLFDELSEEVRDLRRLREQKEAEEAQLKALHGRAVENGNDYAKLKSERDTLAERVGRLEESCDHIEKRIEAIKESSKNLFLAEENIARLSGDLPLLEEEAKILFPDPMPQL